MKSISQKIRDLRIEKGMSQKDLENIFKMARALNISVEYFDTEKCERNLLTSARKNMQSLSELYKIGRGPSSSHTIGPEKAALLFKERNPDADLFVVILYGSLAKTGKGHCTDVVLKNTFYPINCSVKFDYNDNGIEHPNTMDIYAYKNDSELDKIRVFSIGGGSILIAGENVINHQTVYKHNSFCEIAEYCKKREIRLWEYVYEREENIENFLSDIWEAMKNSIKRGLQDEGVLPGGLNVYKKAKFLYNSQHIDESSETRENRLVCSYAYAVG